MRTTALILLSFLIGGCAQTIYPQARPVDPVPVYVADYGIHSSLMLPVAENKFVEYAFGDWGYATENHCGANDALGALLLSFQSTFGRRFITQESGETHPMPVIDGPGKVQKFYASRAQVQELVGRLNERFENGQSKPVRNPTNDTNYVKDTEHYSVANNCNHLTVRSLKQLGCRVEGFIVTSRFKVAPQQVELPKNASGTVRASTFTSTASAFD